MLNTEAMTIGDGVMSKTLRCLSLTWVDVIVSLFLAFALVASPSYSDTGDCDFTPSFFASSLIVALFLLAVAAFLRSHPFSKFGGRLSGTCGRLVGIYDWMFSRSHPTVRVGAFIFLCWLPILICLFPGTCSNDTWGQITQFVTGSFSDHHPIFDTIFIAGIIVTLHNFMRWHLAMFLYVILQAVLTSLSFAYGLVYADRTLCLRKRTVAFALLFFSLFPVYPACAQGISKDALFSWVFVLFFIHYIEVVRTRGDAFLSARFNVRFLLLVVLCCLTKKVGAYVVLASLFFLPFAFRKNALRCIAHLAFAAVFALVVMPFSLSLLGIQPGGQQEKYSLPFQQTARYVSLYGDEIPDDEKEIISKVLDYSNLPSQYNPVNADPVKGYSQRGEDSDYTEYLKVWAKEGLRHPGAYFDAAAAMISGWFSFKEYEPLVSMAWHSQLSTDILPEETAARNSFFTSTATWFDNVYDKLYSIPVLNLPLSFAFYSALAPAYALCTLVQRRKQSPYGILVILPIIFSIVLGCWLAPVSEQTEGIRYLIPLVYTFPMLMLWVKYTGETSGLRKVELSIGRM